MSFGPSNTQKQANNNLGGTSNLALNDLYPKTTAAGTNLLGTGQQTMQQGQGLFNSGVNFFNTLANGNQGNTAAVLQPNIDQIRQGVQGATQAVNTLQPRGGGRAGTNYGLSFAPQQQIGNLFGQARLAGASALPSLGMQQSNLGLGQAGLGGNLFGIGAQGLNAATGANSALEQAAYQQQQQSMAKAAALASGIGSLLTFPLSGLNGTILGKIPGLGGSAGGGGGLTQPVFGWPS